MSDLEKLVLHHLADWRSGWSMGAFGAIAEFHQDQCEAALVDDGPRLTRATARGGIRLDPARLAPVQAVAYETLSPKHHRWSQAVALCVPETQALAGRRTMLTELGPDEEAIRKTERADILFDMGLSLPQCDFCIRTGEPELLAALRANLGRSLFDPASTAMAAILPAHPHRVAITNIGRVEVYQKIGGPDTGGVSPPGPHTHLLPKLLRSGRTHSANTPIPQGLIPLASLHPGNPVIGPLGEERAFDADLFEDFQALLARYGDAEIVSLKKQLVDAMAAGLAPEDFPAPNSRFARAALRLTLRQHARIANDRDDTRLAAATARWRRLHDHVSETESEDDDSPGH